MKYIANPVIVDAFRIVAIGEPCLRPENDHPVLPLELDSGETKYATRGMLARIEPKVGDFLVYQSDGYVYLNPSDVFIRKYSPADGGANGIGWAIKQMSNGARVQRAGWNGKGMWLALQVPDAHSKMGLPYVYMSTVTGQLVPWLASQTDLLATDWQVVA